jgi:hypothetical protein
MTPRDSIFFNNREYTSWSSARDQANKKVATALAGTVWDRVRIESEVEDADEAQFRLVCKTCGKNSQLRTLASGIKNTEPVMPVVAPGTARKA